MGRPPSSSCLESSVPGIRSLQGRTVFGVAGRHLGAVEAVLFHPRDPIAIGLVVRPRPLLYVIPRRERLVSFAALDRLVDDGVVLSSKRLPGETGAERALGFRWDDTVVWCGMPVRSEAGEAVGALHDARFSLPSGAIERIRLSTGIIGDAAIGKLEVPAELIVGFDDEHVVVRAGYNRLAATGGAAKGAAVAVSAVREQGKALSRAVGDVGRTAGVAVRRSMREGLGRKTVDSLRRMMDDGE